jgi:hypothetical protein
LCQYEGSCDIIKTVGFFAPLKRNQKIDYDKEKKEKYGMAELKFEIIKSIGVLSESSNGWKKEVNIVSWNGGDPKYDIRSWNQDRTKMGKGVTLSSAEIEKLRELLG